MAVKKVVKKKRPRRLGGLLIIVIAVICLCAFFYKQKLDLEERHNQLTAEKKRLELLIQAEEKRREQVEDYKAYVQTKSYIEEVARNVLGLVYKNEVIFKANTD